MEIKDKIIKLIEKRYKKHREKLEKKETQNNLVGYMVANQRSWECEEIISEIKRLSN